MASFHMRGRDFSARELVSRTMSPRIAVVPSQGVTELCQLNNLPSLVDLLKPFAEQMEGRGKIAQTEMNHFGRSLFFMHAIYHWPFGVNYPS